ncbi:hypothetical protein IKG06_00500 [Candidatus Saccharibacteria bacterium]|nr:hypothetical protein [Candidatus Saccharibacteria bacterium]
MDNNGGNNNMNESGGPVAGPNQNKNDDPVFKDVLDKIQGADSVLVALSNDPTVDEIAAAMGLSMALDAIGKHVTAIYSGKTPNVLEFLKPRERFETGTESLQDFVIALNKDKADHLRYKIDGDFVKVYVTPYKTTISGDDLEFSRGDYNVDLVIALNVPAATELDAALNEYGRIMHDATSINITNGTAGNFGDVEWVDPNASSISEMVSKLAFALDKEIDSGTATALLTGLVAATDRFKSPETTPEAMALAAKLMGAGADQQLVVQNVQGEVVFDGESGASESKDDDSPKDSTQLEIKHGESDDGEEDKEVNIDGSEMTVDAEKKEEGQEPVAQTNDIAVAPVDPETKIDEPEPDKVETTEAKNDSEPALGGASEPSHEVKLEGANAGEEASASSAPEPEVKIDIVNQASALNNTPVETAASSTEDAVKTAMAAAIGSVEANNNLANAGTDAATTSGNIDEYTGGELADQMLNSIEKENTNVGSTDYGKMIDEALNESLPGEGDNKPQENDANASILNTQDNSKTDASNNVPAETMNVGSDANPGAGLGMQMMTSAGAGLDNNQGANVETTMGSNMIPSATNSDISEEDALNMIQQGKQAAGVDAAVPKESDETPKIITGGGMGFGGQTESAGMNPAMIQTPEVGMTEAVGVPDMNFQGVGSVNEGSTEAPNAMPLPGQEIAPPPMAPMPDFGTMPPATPEIPKVENAAPSVEPAQMSSVTVQPDMSVPVSDNSLNGIPQMPQVVGGDNVGNLGSMANTLQTPNPAVGNNSSSDPGAFKIPGIHT